MRDALRAFGANAEQLAEATPDGEAFAVAPGNWRAVEVFLSLDHSWRIGPMGGALGLDLTAIPAALVLRGVPRRDWPAIHEQLRILEAEALGVWRR